MYTVLEIVQKVLSDIGGDEVNSIDDTVESEQVAQILQNEFDAMVRSREWLSDRTLLKLEPYSDNSLPTHMKAPSNVQKMLTINYDKRALGETRSRYSEVMWAEPDDFLTMCNRRNADASEIVEVTDPSGVVLLIKNNAPPKYYTSFDDSTIVFDSYDVEVDDSLQSSKTQCMAFVTPTLTLTDNAVPKLPEEAMSALLNTVISSASIKLRQQADVVAERHSQRQNRLLSQKQWKVHPNRIYPDYGRRGVK